MPTDETDRQLMTRCIELSRASGSAGEYPYAAVIARRGSVVASSINRVRQDRDVTRHAEVCAIQGAQRALRAVSLDDCTIYVNAEPCAYCSYAIRESRIGRVVFGLTSPHMGGLSKWNVLDDRDLSDAIPEVFAPPPEIIGGYMQDECAKALLDWNPLIATVIKERGLFGVAPLAVEGRAPDVPERRKDGSGKIMRFLRRHLFDRFGRT